MVPEVVVIAYFVPENLAKSSSKRETIGPEPEIQPDFKHSKIYFLAFLESEGFEIGIIYGVEYTKKAQ